MTTTYDAALALRASGLLAAFNRAGILTAADVHVAHRLGAIGAEADDAVLLAAALVVRSTRHGSVVLDLATAEATTSPDVDIDSPAGVPLDVVLDWPADWVARCAASPLVGGPLRMAGSRVWLARYWDQEEQVAAELLTRSASQPADLDAAVLDRGLVRLFPGEREGDQRTAAATCAASWVSVLAGGPGTGKTTTVSRLLALLREQHPTWRIALAAPTGKAAARLEEAVRSSTALLPAEDAARLGELSATTLHRLLGWLPEARSRFRHDRSNRLPVEVVVVDEASMVSLTMMARLLEALRPATRLVLVGDPDQLASVEAGAVLGDLVDRRPRAPAARVAVAALTTNRRFPETSGIALLAAAVQEGRGEDALAVLRDAGVPEVELVEVADDAQLSAAQLDGVRADVVVSGAALLSAAEGGDAVAALVALDAHRLLCAHRRGPRGVQHWSALAARWIADVHPVLPRADGRYAGEPLLVTANDYEIGLYNGDTGVVVDDGGGGLVAAFGRGGAPVVVPLVRLGAVRSLHAMTVHRSQGSQFGRITVLLPEAGSPLGTRETLYTAVTRATSYVRVIGSAEAFVEAVRRPAARATGLRERLSGTLT
ncbi:MAG TPA: exodeoxyribonuclease V subunit alpha [Actinomycetes bacterium]|jgi:exodeoxyribonuclease V alpha subunit|nr:exodeoxyribonuclease V subunit alpha [Actinomycetes bacterium]